MYPNLMRPGRIGRLELPHRIITGPMERSLSNRDGSLTGRYIAYLEARAAGGAGLIQLESTYVDVRGMGHHFQAGCHGDHVVPGLRRAVDAVHRHGAFLGVELYMGGRQTPSISSFRQPIAPSAVPCEVLYPVPVPRAMTEADFTDVRGRFTDAAKRAAEAGVDMIHLHGAHGYLLGSFISPFSNHRTDGYGGSLRNRARFPLEIVDAVRSELGPEFTLGYRLSVEEYVEGGLSAAEGIEFARMLADSGIDLIDVSGGIYESASQIIHGSDVARGGFVQNAALVKEAVGDACAVSVAQRLNVPALAESVLTETNIDFVSLTRAFHADPQFVGKVRAGEPDRIVPCIACHECTNRLEANEPAGCAVNSASTNESRPVAVASQPQDVAVVGAGPAGIEAALNLRRAGHSVTLFEAEETIGGQLNLSGLLADEYLDLIHVKESQLDGAGIEVRLGTRVTADEVIRQGLSVVVVATGASSGLPTVSIGDGVDHLNVFSAMRRSPGDWPAGKILITTADHVSCKAATLLATSGLEVVMLDPGTEMAWDLRSPAKERVAAPAVGAGFEIRLESTLEGFDSGVAMVQSRGEFLQIEGVASVVAGGRIAQNWLYEDLIALGFGGQLLIIGDAVRPRTLYDATHEAADIVSEVNALRQISV